MAHENLNPQWGREEAIANARKIIDEIDENLSRTMGTQGLVVTDPQTQRILRVLRILVDEVDRIGGGEEILGGGIEGPFVDNGGNPL